MFYQIKTADILADTMAENKLGATKIKNAGPGLLGDGGGLYLKKQSQGVGQWHYRYTFAGARVEMGLGGWPAVSLSQARQLRDQYRSLLKVAGKDPRAERDRQRREAAKADHTLEAIAHEAFEARKAELRDDGNAGRWFTPIKLHVLPQLGKFPIEDLDQQDIKGALESIWHSKADTARKAMNRLGIIIRHAAAMGLDVDVQATEKAKALLGKSRHISANIPSMPWLMVPEFYSSLTKGSVVHLALRLLILTALRSKPIRFCRLDEIHGDVWIVPAENMKAQKGHEAEFRVPLSQEALAVIEQAKPLARDGYLFPSQRRGVIADATMSLLMKRRGLEARPHGFRSSFRTWCAEATSTSEQVAETALAHTTGTKVARAYRRTDFLEQRRKLMNQWADYVSGVNTSVVAING